MPLSNFISILQISCIGDVLIVIDINCFVSFIVVVVVVYVL